jgi:phosphate-selective porin
VLAACVGSSALAEPAVEGPAASDGWQLAPFSLRNDAADTGLALIGYLQADARAYPNWTVAGDPGGTLRAPTSQWRRLRLGLDGRWRRLQLLLSAAPAFDAGHVLKDAWVSLRLSSALQLRAGHQKLPVSPEWLTSDSRIDLMERAVAVDALAPGRDWGLQALGRYRRLEYRAGLFAGDRTRSPQRAGATLAGRLVLSATHWLDLGCSGSRGHADASARADAAAGAANGFTASTATGYRLFDAVGVDGTRTRIGADTVASAGPAGLKAEYLRESDERRAWGSVSALPPLRGRGFALTSTWLLTGERKSPLVHPRRPLPHGPGAVELAARYEELRVDGSASRCRWRALDGGVSWWPTAIVRVITNAVVERYGDARVAPEPGRRGPYLSLTGRVQLMLP